MRTSLTQEDARPVVPGGSDLSARVEGLRAAVEAARGRLDEATLASAEALVEQAGARIRASADHTVVALAGATGSGKSSTFNAIAGLDLSAVGVRRPTTSWATACTWGSRDATALLEWLGIPPRHQVSRDSMLDTGREVKDLDGLILLDLPDHDSTEMAHRLEVDRLIELADLFVWVLDPQKYADAAIHDRFLRPLAAHRGVMLVVLNHIDEVPVDRRERMLADLRRLLEADGLTGVPIMATSAKTGEGTAELRSAIAERVAAKSASNVRLGIRIAECVEELAGASGAGRPVVLGSQEDAELRAAVADAAGVPVVIDAVGRATRLRAGHATGWPPLSWIASMRRDPLDDLELDASARELIARAREELPEADRVQRARIESAVRTLADRLTEGLARPWANAVRRASTERVDDLLDRLDEAIGSVELGISRPPLWAGLVRVVQWLLLLAAVTGAAWLATLAVMRQLGADPPSAPEALGLPVPTLLFFGGLGLGLVLAVLARILVGASARGRARRAEDRLLRVVEEVTEAMVVAPLRAELDAYATTVDGLRRARG